MVVATGDGLTDVADAYLVDHSVTERVVVVASLGATIATGGNMDIPNGDTDPWADTIVANRFRYIQVSAFYNQQDDVPPAKVAQLPANPLGTWMAAKVPVYPWNPASDQVAVLAVGVPTFATSVTRVAPAGRYRWAPPSGRVWGCRQPATAGWSPHATARPPRAPVGAAPQGPASAVTN